MMPTIPFIIVGSMVLIILNFPFIEKVVPASFLVFLSDVLSPLTQTTMSLVALFLAFLMGYNYVKTDVSNKANPIYCGLTTLIAFFVLTPFHVQVGEEIVDSVSFDADLSLEEPNSKETNKEVNYIIIGVASIALVVVILVVVIKNKKGRA